MKRPSRISWRALSLCYEMIVAINGLRISQDLSWTNTCVTTHVIEAAQLRY
jgi:hypothetical protein